MDEDAALMAAELLVTCRNSTESLMLCSCSLVCLSLPVAPWPSLPEHPRIPSPGPLHPAPAAPAQPSLPPSASPGPAPDPGSSAPGMAFSLVVKLWVQSEGRGRGALCPSIESGHFYCPDSCKPVQPRISFKGMRDPYLLIEMHRCFYSPPFLIHQQLLPLNGCA